MRLGQRIFPIEPRPYLPKALAGKVSDFNGRLAKLESAQNELAARRAGGHGKPVDLARVDFDALEDGMDRRVGLQLLQNELELRRTWIALQDEAHEAAAKALDDARAKLERTALDVRKKLEGIGYARHIAPGQPDVGSWQNGFITTHPAVRIAQEEHDTIFNQFHDRSQHASNEETIERIEQELECARCRALGIPQPTGRPTTTEVAAAPAPDAAPVPKGHGMSTSTIINPPYQEPPPWRHEHADADEVAT